MGNDALLEMSTAFVQCVLRRSGTENFTRELLKVCSDVAGHAASDEVAASQDASTAAAPDEALGDDEPDEEWCRLHGLLDAETCSDVAKHCNETKQAAKVVQVRTTMNTAAGAQAHALPEFATKLDGTAMIAPMRQLSLWSYAEFLGGSPTGVCFHHSMQAGDKHAPDHVCTADVCSHGSVQETSMRLFLCALLARRPVVAQGIVTSLNGQRFFHLYVPELGLEVRIESEEIQPAPVVTDWNKDARCALQLMLDLDLCPEGDAFLHICKSLLMQQCMCMSRYEITACSLCEARLAQPYNKLYGYAMAAGGKKGKAFLLQRGNQQQQLPQLNDVSIFLRP